MRMTIPFFIIFFLFPFTAFSSGVQAVQQKRAYEEEMMHRAMMERQMVEQAQAQAVQRAMIERGIQQGIGHQLQAGMPTLIIEETFDGMAFPPASEFEQVSEMNDILQALERSSRVWPLIADWQPKVFIIQQYIKYFHSQGVVLRLSAEHYAEAIDAMFYQEPEALAIPFIDVLRVVSILEYDFDNGQNKDQMALQILGKEAFLANLERLGF